MAEETRGLQIVEEKTVLFYEDELIAVKLEDGSVYVPVRRLCDNLGIDWSAQRRRLVRDRVLSEAINRVAVTATRLDPHVSPEQSMVCLPLDLIPGWLFGISASRVKKEIQEKLVRYQRECFRVLWDAFKGDLLPELQQPGAHPTGAEQTLAHIEALYNLARQQVAMERWLMRHDRRLDDVEEIVADLRLRVQGPERLVTDEQAAELANAVKAVAHRLTQRKPGTNWYQSIYGEIYRRFRVSSYRRVPAARFGEVIAWLDEYARAIGD